MGQVVIDIIKSYLENGYDYISNEKKYYFMNKFSPKKQPEAHIKRSSIDILYSWTHYAPHTWYEHIRKVEEDAARASSQKNNPAKKCSFCGAPESELRKHKVCSACKQVLYCSLDC